MAAHIRETPKSGYRAAIADRAGVALAALGLALGAATLAACASDDSAAPSGPLIAAKVTDPSKPDPYRDLFKPRPKRGVSAVVDPLNPIDTRAGATPAGGGAPAGALPSAAIDVFGGDGRTANAGPAVPPAAVAPIASPATNTAAQGWTVVLAAFRGDDAERNAATVRMALAAKPELQNAFVERRGEAVIIGIGRFAQPSDAPAQDALKRIQALTIDGRPALAGAFLAPPDVGSLAGTMPQYDLRQAKQRFGDGAKFTLQVAVYGPADLRATPTADDLVQIRKDAEASVAKLRSEGEPAFYFHGPTKSTVTIGLFNGDDATRINLPEAAALRERFPHNLYNGGAVKSRVAGKETIQPSVMVTVPAK